MSRDKGKYNYVITPRKAHQKITLIICRIDNPEYIQYNYNTLKIIMNIHRRLCNYK
jgi:hypothetical protein